MFSKLSGKVLVLLVLVLGGIFLISQFIGPGAEQRTFPDKLLQLDTAQVNSITISPKAEGHQAYTLSRIDTGWRISRDEMEFSAEGAQVARVLGEFMVLKPRRLAGRNEENWAKYEVNDSLSTTVAFQSAEGTASEIVVGKFSFDQATRSGTSFVRLQNEEETYAVDGFLSMAVNVAMNSWRNKMVLKGVPANWTELAYTYPADSGFVLTRGGDPWLMDGAPTDSTIVTNYLGTLTNLQSVNFVDDVQVPASPDFSVRITQGASGQIVTIDAYQVGGEHGYLINSSLNRESYFSEAQSQLMDKLYPWKFFFQSHEGHDHN